MQTTMNQNSWLSARTVDSDDNGCQFLIPSPFHQAQKRGYRLFSLNKSSESNRAAGNVKDQLPTRHGLLLHFQAFSEKLHVFTLDWLFAPFGHIVLSEKKTRLGFVGSLDRDVFGLHAHA